ncbi:uncharacterized protein BXIN_1374 [Babesia sp. Xinjiang]|uniref:uncharacterized protein n=1 Tax=Babesia sp. Xinjiang TaxID=462227 RepID=UPI000A230879|nr:uncharacterized protein BXIN_1374 [Babesia sp. Xinjiang]ORM40225.1 hypothetical protein BXIN_1374 [Babesia sp. Xinjiang]
MDVVEVKPAGALQAVRRRPLERRPLYVHEGVIARLETYERKRESLRGSGLQYVLRNLNQHCKQLSPERLLEALRILSENQLFDRRTLYNLYETIALNVLYFTPQQHRVLLQCIGKCLAYTVQGTKLPRSKECEFIVSQLNLVLDRKTEQSAVSNGSELFDPCKEGLNSVTTLAVTSAPTSDIDVATISIGDFDGGPVPLSELNRLSYDIVRKISAIYNDTGQPYRRGVISDLVDILCLNLRILLKLFPAMDIPKVHILECTKAICNQFDLLYVGRFESSQVLIEELLSYGNIVADAISILLLNTFPKLIHSTYMPRGLTSDVTSVSNYLKLDLLRDLKKVESAYIAGDTLLFNMMSDSFYSFVKQSPKKDEYTLSLETQQFIIDMKQLWCQLDRFCNFVVSLNHGCKDDLLRLLSLHAALKKVLGLFDNHGQLVKGEQRYCPNDLYSSSLDTMGCIQDISAKSVCYFLGILSENRVTTCNQIDQRIGDTLRQCFYKIQNNCKPLTTADILYVLESCYYRFGYLHHYAARVMLNTAMSRHVVTHMDTVLAANMHLLCLTIPYNMVTYVDPKSFLRVTSYVESIGIGDEHFGSSVSKVPNRYYGCAVEPTARPRQHDHFPLAHFDRRMYRNRCLCSSYNYSLSKVQQPLRKAVTGNTASSKVCATYLYRIWEVLHPDRLRKVMSLVH